jgi:multidrug efflux system outer membrane protein
LNWELDFLGRIRRSVKSQKFEAAAKSSDLQAMQVAVVSQVASSYIDLRAAQKMLRLSKANADSQRETLGIVRGRLEAGRGSTHDLSRAEVQLDTTLLRIPQLETQVAVGRHRPAVLAGLTPTALDARLQNDADMTAVPIPSNPPRRRRSSVDDQMSPRPSSSSMQLLRG